MHDIGGVAGAQPVAEGITQSRDPLVATRNCRGRWIVHRRSRLRPPAWPPTVDAVDGDGGEALAM